MKANNGIKITDFRLKDSFWSSYKTLVKDVVIPYQHAILEDQIPDAAKSHAIENFRIAAALKEGEFFGMVFQDSDVAKWIEAAAYSIANSSDPKLEAEVDKIVDIIEKAQMEDGYLNTYFILKEPDKRWTNLQEAHELYCAGHMIEAAVAYYEATGKDKLLKVMMRMADHIVNRFGKGKSRGYSGHPEIELALMKLYRVTGEERYLGLCQYFIDERGTQPNYFIDEKEHRGWTIWNADARDKEYTQSHAPVREQMDAVGHSVRAVYLYTAMADLASEIDDEELKKACENLWNSITKRRMYITGGIGSTCIGEAFSVDYDLPNDSVYAETCASIGLIFFAQKMLELSPKGEYADVIERALYNTILAGMSQDGKRFFYVNPLEVTPGISGKAQTLRHSLPERPKWFGCACCPPNVARIISSLEQYIWSENDNTVFSNLFIGGEVDLTKTKGIKIKTETKYPYDGYVKYTVMPEAKSDDITLAIRIPSWSNSDKTHIRHNGKDLKLTDIIKDGYAYVTGSFEQGDVIELSLDMTPRRIYSHTAVRNNEGCTALVYGPLVYCFEGVDNDGDVHRLRIDKSSDIHVTDSVSELGKIKVLKVQGYCMVSQPELYSDIRPTAQPFTLTAIPYYTWGNRGLNQMRVWIPEE